jgi:hypothetical protein
MSLSWSEEPVTAGPAEQVARAMLAQWRALAATPISIRCDCCGEGTPWETCTVLEADLVLCQACAEAPLLGEEGEGDA